VAAGTVKTRDNLLLVVGTKQAMCAQRHVVALSRIVYTSQLLSQSDATSLEDGVLSRFNVTGKKKKNVVWIRKTN
jgi:hypothetical protein